MTRLFSVGVIWLAGRAIHVRHDVIMRVVFVVLHDVKSEFEATPLRDDCDEFTGGRWVRAFVDVQLPDANYGVDSTLRRCRERRSGPVDAAGYCEEGQLQQ